MTPRTSWTYLPQSEVRAPGGGMTHSAGWDWIVPLLGIVAIGCLVIGRQPRPRVAGSVFSAAIASGSLAAAAAAALGHWLDLMSGSLNDERWAITPAPAVAYFAGTAAVGMVAALVLLGHWLHQGDTKARS